MNMLGPGIASKDREVDLSSEVKNVCENGKSECSGPKSVYYTVLQSVLIGGSTVINVSVSRLLSNNIVLYKSLT